MAQKHVIVMDTGRDEINTASEESVQLLRRLVKILESNATVDSANRQRVVVDAAATTAVTMTSTTLTAMPIANQFWYEEAQRARQSYALGIRKNLYWTT